MLCIIVLLFLLVISANGQSSETFRIPNGGDSCNVVNLNFGQAEGRVEPERGPQGSPGKRGSHGVRGFKGSKGERGPKGKTAEVDSTLLTKAAMKALSAVSCHDLLKTHGISETGYYLMRSNRTAYPVYNYCDFEERENIADCDELKENLNEDFVNGYYLISNLRHFEFCAVKDCKEVKRKQAKVSTTTGGVFEIFPDPAKGGVEVFCDLETDGGGWTVFQRRMDGSVDFFRRWHDYENGFGQKEGEFWLGLETIHQLTKSGELELRIDLEDFSQNKVYAKYGPFFIASRQDNYRLSVGRYNLTSTAGNSLQVHNGMMFSTKDADNDRASRHCALKNNKGAWWYNDCQSANLNGLYHSSPGSGLTGILWYGWKNNWDYIKFTEMKFRKT